MRLLRRCRGLPGHEFWDDAISLAQLRDDLENQVLTHAQVTDAHPVALAEVHGGRVATSYRGMLALAPESVLLLKA
jgi:hypothetical protein